MSDRQGLVIVHTGNGKGKTTAALGMALRAWGHGLKVLVVQFIKGGWKYGELYVAERLPAFVIRQAGEGFVRHGQGDDKDKHRRAAEEAFEAAAAEVASGKWDMVVLDEINYAVSFGLVPLDAVLRLIGNKPAPVHLVLTGREAPKAVIDRADLVTEMKEIKHPYKRGVMAQQGIEF